MQSAASWAVAVGLIANIILILSLGWKISRFMALTEYKVSMLWNDYARRAGFDPKIEQ